MTPVVARVKSERPKNFMLGAFRIINFFSMTRILDKLDIIPAFLDCHPGP
jgi:hypothetical protein